MKIYENTQEFLDELSRQELNNQGFSDLQVVKVVHTSDESYRHQVNSGKDELGFQPCLLTFANPFTLKTHQALIKNVDDTAAKKLKDAFRKQYADDFPKKFDSFTPDVFDAFTEYDDWESFDKSWLTRDGKSVMHFNLPLLFDHLSDIADQARRQTGEKVLKYQRLLVTTYFISEGKFYRFFIKNVDDAELDRIKMLVEGRVTINSEKLFA